MNLHADQFTRCRLNNWGFASFQNHTTAPQTPANRLLPQNIFTEGNMRVVTFFVAPSTSNSLDLCQNGSSNLLTPYREKPRSTWSVVAYPRPAFSATKWTNHTPINLNNMPKFFKAKRHAEITWKIVIPRSFAMEALSWRSGRAIQHPAVQSPVHP